MNGVGIEGICVCLPPNCVANDEQTAKATGIIERRIANPGVSALDLCIKAADRVIADTGIKKEDISAVIAVSFTQRYRMPCSAAEAQARLGLSRDIMAFDVMLACSGYGYGLFLAQTIARDTKGKVLLLDGDKQSTFVKTEDSATSPLFSDGGSATIVGVNGDEDEWSFKFATDGEKGDALRLEHDGAIKMDGFGVFKFVANDVVNFLRQFMSDNGVEGGAGLDYFIPHQANVYMVKQLAKSLNIPEAKLGISADRFGNLSSASIPATIAHCKATGRVLIAGFGGGLSISAALITISNECKLSVING